MIYRNGVLGYKITPLGLMLDWFLSLYWNRPPLFPYSRRCTSSIADYARLTPTLSDDKFTVAHQPLFTIQPQNVHPVTQVAQIKTDFPGSGKNCLR